MNNMECMPVHETKTHGTAALPYTVYHSIIPEFIPSFPLHWHDDFEVIYCARGQVLVTVWGQAYRLCAGDLVVILPRGVHSIDQCGEANGEYYNIMFHPSLFKGAGDDPCYTKYVLPFLNGEKSMECFHPAPSGFNRAVTPLPPVHTGASQGRLLHPRAADEVSVVPAPAPHEPAQHCRLR